MLKVVPIAATALNIDNIVDETPYRFHGFSQGPAATDADDLAEFAGRACYQSWGRPNPATATNDGYLANILKQGHESVLEHASITFYVAGVSRSLTHELIRHRHLSFSELSQRYVDMDQAKFAIPPLILASLMRSAPDGTTLQEVVEHFQSSDFFSDVREAYSGCIEDISEIMPDTNRKQIREAARCVMPNCTETKIVVTGNVRAWRDVLKKRYHVAADAEIREFAAEVLWHLRRFAPSSFQDFPDKPFGS